MAKFRTRLVRRIRDTGAQFRTEAERELEAAGEAKMEHDPHLNRGCMGCMIATAVFFGALIFSLLFTKCIR